MMTASASISEIATRCGVTVETGHTLAEFTTIGVGGPLACLLKPDTIESMGKLLVALREAGFRPRLLGGGANLVGGRGPITDPVILTRGIKHGPIIEGTRVRAGCGVVVKKLVLKCVQAGLAGLEFAEGIPGTVGGTVFMNAGSYGGQMSDVAREAAWFNDKGEFLCRTISAADFSYRKSPFGAGDAIVEVVFHLTPADPAMLTERVKEISGRRLKSQPPGERSAGCVFKNPAGDSAGRLIDSLGLKGLAVGGASVSMAHGNFIVNRGDASPDDVLKLIELIKTLVHERSGITLVEEVIIWS